jgi:hypothetical protein
VSFAAGARSKGRPFAGGDGFSEPGPARRRQSGLLAAVLLLTVAIPFRRPGSSGNQPEHERSSRSSRSFAVHAYAASFFSAVLLRLSGRRSLRDSSASAATIPGHDAAAGVLNQASRVWILTILAAHGHFLGFGTSSPGRFRSASGGGDVFDDLWLVSQPLWVKLSIVGLGYGRRGAVLPFVLQTAGSGRRRPLMFTARHGRVRSQSPRPWSGILVISNGASPSRYAT